MPDLEKNLIEREKEVRQLLADVEGLQYKNSQGEQIIQTKTSLIKRLESDISDRNYSIKELNASVDELRIDNSTLKEKFDMIKASKKLLDKELLIIETEKLGFQNALKELQEANSVLELEVDAWKRTVTDKELEMTALKLDIKSQARTIDHLESEKSVFEISVQTERLETESSVQTEESIVQPVKDESDLGLLEGLSPN